MDNQKPLDQISVQVNIA